MIYANIEPKVYAVATWLTTYLPTYLALAGSELAPWPSDTSFPSALELPDDDYTPPALKKAAVGSTIPPSGPFPYLLVALDSIAIEDAGQASQWVTLSLKAVLAIQENSERRIGAALMRYSDALIMAVGSNVTMDGTFDEIKLTAIDTDELPQNRVGFLSADLTARFEITCE